MLKASENYVKKIVEEGMRIDERKFDQFRQVEVETNFIKKAEGSARVSIGNSVVIVGVKMAVGEPFPDNPNEGVLMVNAELDPVASPDFEPGPPSDVSVELARVVDRGLRESKCIDLEKLCIKEGEKVWMVNVDIHVIDHDGNLIDAASLGSIAALKSARIPKYENEKIVFGEYQGEIPMKDTPIEVTIAKISGKLLVDTTLEEESALEARVTIGTTEKGDICAVQKGGTGFFTTEELREAADLSIAKGKELRKLI